MALATHSADKRPDALDLEFKLKETYRQVAQEPQGQFLFETGRALTERLGYPRLELSRIPPLALEAFSGVGYHMDLADIRSGETVLDLGCGSGTDTFFAALMAGDTGHVSGVDMTEELLAKAEQARMEAGFRTVSFHKAYIEDLPFDDGSMDVVLGNGVVNLSADKGQALREAARVLRRGGRLAISDIVAGQELPEHITADAMLWAAGIGGAMRRDDYRQALLDAGFRLITVRENPQYRFLSDAARSAGAVHGVRSVSLLAIRQAEKAAGRY